MAKLSRKEKYQNLRDSLEQESEPQVGTKQARSTRMAAPDFKADQKLRGPVIEDLLGEVKQYNLDNGELVTDDTQMQILHDLSTQEQAAARRSVHFETMEQNEDVGGTTRNLYGSDLSSLMSNQASTRRTSQSIKSNNSQVKTTTASQTKKVQNEEPDFLDLFTPGQQTNEEPMVEIVEEETKEKPVLFGSTRRKRRKTSRPTNAQSSQDDLEKTLDSQSLDALFTTTEVSVDDPYFLNQDDGPELPFTNRNQQGAYQEPVEEEEYYEEEQPSGRFASLISKVRRKTRPDVEEYEEENVEEEEPPIVVSKKAKKASPSTGKSNPASKQTKQVKQSKSKQATKEDSSNSEQVSTSAVIFMVACCVILLLLILLTIFWMSKLGIF